MPSSSTAAGALLDGALSMRLEAKTAVALVGGRAMPLQAFAGTAVHAVAGIGNPERFFNMLRSRGIEVLGHPLTDHARIGAEDIMFADDKSVLMTEKDAVKCKDLADATALVRPGERVFRRRRIDYTARHRDAQYCKTRTTAARTHPWISGYSSCWCARCAKVR